jgi:hypothetical protein
MVSLKNSSDGAGSRGSRGIQHNVVSTGFLFSHFFFLNIKVHSASGTDTFGLSNLY